MAAEAVRYIDSKPALNDGLQADVMQLRGKCQAKYRVHYSAAKARRLEDHRFLAGERITAEHPSHQRSFWIQAREDMKTNINVGSTFWNDRHGFAQVFGVKVQPYTKNWNMVASSDTIPLE